MELVAISESQPGEKWISNFRRKWPSYRQWYLSEGLEARTSFKESYRALQIAMPELVPLFERLCDLVGEDDVARRFLTFYNPPPVIAGCSVVVVPGEEPQLLRNYDFGPDFFESSLLLTTWLGQRSVIGASEAFWGLLDGMNDRGLAVALTFGGRVTRGKGFGTPILLRYLLEVCNNTREALEALRAVPCVGVQNLLLLDHSGDHAVAYLSPDRPLVVKPLAVTTNHQDRIEWPEAARWSQTVERAALLQSLRDESALRASEWVDRFLQPPLYRSDYAERLGTLYTALYRPGDGRVEFYWPGQEAWRQSFNKFQEGRRPLPV